MSKEMEIELQIAREERPVENGIMDWGEPSIFACPECHGVLLQMTEGSNIRFRCHTGHGYSLESLMAEMTDKTEDALWNSIRALEESVLLMRRMAHELQEQAQIPAAALLLQKASEAEYRAKQVRQAVIKHGKVDGVASESAAAPAEKLGERLT